MTSATGVAGAFAALGLAACWSSHPEFTDGAVPDAGDARDTADAPDVPDVPDDADTADTSDVVGDARFVPDDPDPAPGRLVLHGEVDGDTLLVHVVVRAADPVFGVAARVRYDGTVLALQRLHNRLDFPPGSGAPVLEWAERAVEGTDLREAWIGLAAPSPETTVDASTGVRAVTLRFDIRTFRDSRVELIPGRSAALSAPDLDFATTEVAGGRLEVAP
jgi:hypothetical protein